MPVVWEYEGGEKQLQYLQNYTSSAEGVSLAGSGCGFPPEQAGSMCRGNASGAKVGKAQATTDTGYRTIPIVQRVRIRPMPVGPSQAAAAPRYCACQTKLQCEPECTQMDNW